MALRSNPTAANILSSLQISGATAKGGQGAEGMVPVLNAAGKLDKSFIPLDAISQEISLPPLDRTAYVDRSSEAETPDGSIAKPYKTLAAAAQAGFANFILSPGDYGAVTLDLNNVESSWIRILGTGSVSFTTLNIRNYKENANIVLLNASVTSSLMMASNLNSNLYLMGFATYNTVQGTLDNIDDPFTATKYLRSLNIGPCVRLVNPPVNAETLLFLAEDSRIGNSTEIPGATARDVIKRMRATKITVPTFAMTLGHPENGISCSESQVEVDESLNAYGLMDLGNTLVKKINEVFYRKGSSLEVTGVSATGAVQAASVTAGTVTATTKVVAPRIQIGSSILKVDDEGFLVVEEE